MIEVPKMYTYIHYKVTLSVVVTYLYFYLCAYFCTHTCRFRLVSHSHRSVLTTGGGRRRPPGRARHRGH